MTKFISISLILTLCVGFLLTTAIFAQTSTKPEMKYVRVSVSDIYGRRISGLEAEKFSFEEKGKQQKIEYFEEEKTPASILMLFDVNYYPGLSAFTALKLIQRFDSETDYSIIAFNGKVETLADWKSTDEVLVESLNKIANNEDKKNPSVFNDSLSLALDNFKNVSAKKKVILVFSNGYDRKSETSINSLTRKVKETDSVIYGITFNDGNKPYLLGSTHETLDKLAEKSGGRVYDFYYPPGFQPNFRIVELRSIYGGGTRRITEEGYNFPKQEFDFDERYNQNAEIITSLVEKTYLIGYYPANKNGKNYKIKIKVDIYDKEGKEIRTSIITKEL